MIEIITISFVTALDAILLAIGGLVLQESLTNFVRGVLLLISNLIEWEI